MLVRSSDRADGRVERRARAQCNHLQGLPVSIGSDRGVEKRRAIDVFLHAGTRRSYRSNFMPRGNPVRLTWFFRSGLLFLAFMAVVHAFSVKCGEPSVTCNNF